MNRLTDSIRSVKRNVKTIDNNFAELFGLSDKFLGSYVGTLEEVALAHAVLRLRTAGCVCLSCKSEAFASLRQVILDSTEKINALEQTQNHGGNDEEGESIDTGDTADKCG